ncbi:MAG: archease [Anaerolineales bacterium]
MSQPPYHEIDHTADWALEVRGANLGELLANAAEGMIELMQAERSPSKGRRRRLRLHAADAESLLVAWLEELVVRMEMAPVTFGAFQVRANEGASLEAEYTEWTRAGLKKMIKAVTFHDLRVESGRNGWQTTVVFDV